MPTKLATGKMSTAKILKFPKKGGGSLNVRVVSSNDGGYVVITNRGHAWHHDSFADALAEAREVAAGLGVNVEIQAVTLRTRATA
jgi:hypothetical protein